VTHTKKPELPIPRKPEFPWEDDTLTAHRQGCRRFIEGVTRGAFRMIATYRNTWACPGCRHWRIRQTTRRVYDQAARDNLWLGPIDDKARDAATRLARLHGVNHVYVRRTDLPYLFLAESNLRPRGRELQLLPLLEALELWEQETVRGAVERVTACKAWRWRIDQHDTDWITAQIGRPDRLVVARYLAGFPDRQLNGVQEEIAVARFIDAYEEIADLDDDDIKELRGLLNEVPAERLLDHDMPAWSTRSGQLILNRARRLAEGT